MIEYFTKTTNLTSEQVTPALTNDPETSFGWTYLRGRGVPPSTISAKEFKELISVGAIYMVALEEQLRTMAMTCVCTVEDCRLMNPGEEPRPVSEVMAEARELADHAIRGTMEMVAKRMAEVLPDSRIVSDIEQAKANAKAEAGTKQAGDGQ